MKIIVNNQELEVSGQRVLIDELREAGYDIPSMCYASGAEHHPSCMVCMVKDVKTDQMIPSCSTMPYEGMEIETDSDEVKARLSILCKSNDGFTISEADLRLRGPGDFFGSRQHGLPATHIADLGGDIPVLQRAQSEANALLAEDPQLARAENAALRESVERIFRQSSDSFN